MLLILELILPRVCVPSAARSVRREVAGRPGRHCLRPEGAYRSGRAALSPLLGRARAHGSRGRLPVWRSLRRHRRGAGA
eukprot:6074184-Prymnesium_polylepis.1